MVPKKAASKLALIAVTVLLGSAHAQPVGAATPLSFVQAVTLAAEGPAVKLAAGQVTLAQGQLGVASAFVSGDLNAGYTQDLTPELDGTSGAGSFDPIVATATLNVLPYGNAADAAKRAEWAVREAEAVLEAARTTAVVDAATRYLEALRFSQEEEALAAAVGVAQTALEATRTRLEVGAASTADLLDAQIALSQAQNDLGEVALEEDGALAALAQTLGVRVAAVEGEPPSITLPEIRSTAPLIEGRSDVLNAQLAVQRATLDRAAALRGALPTGRAGLSYGHEGVQLGAGFDTETFGPSLELSYDPDGLPDEVPEAGLRATVGVSIPLDSGVGAGLAVAETAVTNAELLLEQTRAQARLELGAAQSQLTTAQNSLAAARALVEGRRLALKTARTRLELGLIPAFEVEQAEADLLGAQVQRGRLEDNVLLARLIFLQILALDPLEVF